MELLKVVKGIHQRFNPDLQIEGILFTMDNCRYNNAKRNKQAIKTTYGNDIKIFEQTIPRTESLAETASEGVSIFSYDGKREVLPKILWCSTSLLSLDLPATEDSSTFPILG